MEIFHHSQKDVRIAAADFALRSLHQKGAILCDDAGLGTRHEAMLIITQKWLEGRRILLAIPNADLLFQWKELVDEFYSVPHVVLTDYAQWDAVVSEDDPNPFLQDAVVITTYDFAAGHEDEAKAVPWDLAVFEEANALSAVYQGGNQQAKALKRIAGGAFKLLLTGTPIEKKHHGSLWADLVHRRGNFARRTGISGPVSPPPGVLPRAE